MFEGEFLLLAALTLDFLIWKLTHRGSTFTPFPKECLHQFWFFAAFCFQVTIEPLRHRQTAAFQSNARSVALLLVCKWCWLNVVGLLRRDRSSGLPVQRLVQPHQEHGGSVRSAVVLCPAQQRPATHQNQGRSSMSTRRHSLPDQSQLLPQVTGRTFIILLFPLFSFFFYFCLLINSRCFRVLST